MTEQRVLTVAPTLKLPVDAITQTFVIFGKRGSGKTNTAVVLAEEMIPIAPVVILDPIDVWWGLKSSFDGKGEGLKVYVFGGEHGDLPLEPTSGELMARLFIEHRISMVLSMQGWSVTQRAGFVTAFCIYLLQHNGRVPVHVFLEEADAFVPQRPYKGEEAMLGATDRLVRWGRKEGIGATLITQRSAKVNKDVTTQAETLIAHRTIGPQDRDAIDEWVKFHGSKAERDAVIGSLAKLKDGQAWVWSPEWLNILQWVQVRRRSTFDSAATPKVGEKRVAPKHLAQVDLDRLREQLGKTIDQAKANDPRELRKRIQELEKQLSTSLPQIVEKVVTVEVPSLTPSLARVLASLDDTSQVMATHFALLRQGTEELAKPVRGIGARKQSIPMVAHSDTFLPPITARVPSAVPRVAAHQNGHLSKAQLKILEAVSWLTHTYRSDRATRHQVAFMAGYKPSTGHFTNMLGSLRTEGLVDYPEPGMVSLTAQGTASVEPPIAPLTEAELRNMVMARLNSTQQRILGAVLRASMGSIGRDKLAIEANMTPGTGHFTNVLGSLRSLGLVDYPSPGLVVATKVLYLEG